MMRRLALVDDAEFERAQMELAPVPEVPKLPPGASFEARLEQLAVAFDAYMSEMYNKREPRGPVPEIFKPFTPAQAREYVRKNPVPVT